MIESGWRRDQGTEAPTTERDSHVVSIIIPAYNEEATLAAVIERIHRVDTAPYRKEIIVCDDGSTDGTASVLAQLGEHLDVRTYVSPINLGKGAAVRMGVKLASGGILLIQDADLELDPGDYPALLEPFADPKTTVVYGSRFLGRVAHIPRRSRWANRFLTALTNVLFGGHLTDMETAYKVFRREAIEGLRLRCVRFDIEPELTARFLRFGHEIREVPVRYDPRTVDEGKKISLADGFDAVYTLIRCRLFS